MYREPHLQKKSDECANIYREWWHLKYELKDEEKAKICREKWGKCVSEHGEMISQEVKTNPRYQGIRMI
tara:strand:- start:369 stop:575 length:207 start_codon:yes stop_codon:yes gene_type:complete